jgi:ribosomal protein L40E
MNRPYQERLLSENTLLRKFSKRVRQSQLEWHRDRENRIIEVLSGKDWKFQRDNELPKTLQEGDRVYVTAGEYHRLLKGSGDLYVKIYKEGKKKLSKKQMKIAKAAPPPDKITGADFAALRKKNLSESNSDMLVCPRCGTHNHKDAEECKKCTLKMGAKHNGKEWKPVSSENITDYQAKKYKMPKGSKSKRVQVQKRINKKVKAGKKLSKKDYDDREAVEKLEREREGYKTRRRSDTKVSESLTRMQLRQLILETLEEEMLDSIPEEDHPDLNEKLSAKTKATLKKKAEKRGLTPSSVYAEYRKGLAAWASSGSRKGMSQHQWAHARVNSATPSKPWAVVKKAKKKKKK